MPQINPYVPVSAVTVGGDAVATLPASVFLRKLYGLTVAAVRGATVKVYMGAATPSNLISQSPNGWSNTDEYSNARDIPAGMVVTVVWPGQGANAAACSATFHQAAA